jgi:hypothetical protein
VRVSLIVLSLFIASCTGHQSRQDKTIESADAGLLRKNQPTTSNQTTDGKDAEIVERFTDSLHIGKRGACKVDLIKYRLLDDQFVLVKFYVKESSGSAEVWKVTNVYQYETNAIMDFQPELSDYNNDSLADLTFISGTAARGANEVRRLFVYDASAHQLIAILNAQDYPNLRYNPVLDCIDAFMVHGASTTVFARLAGDSLKTFAYVDNSEDYHRVFLVDKNGQERELYKVKSKGVYIRHSNFQPLSE